MQLPAPLLNTVRLLGCLDARANTPAMTAGRVRAALRDPVWPDGGRRAVFDIVRPGERVCFVLSDQTRTTAASAVLDALLPLLLDRGCSLRDMTATVATGVHRAPTPAEVERILGRQNARLFAGRIRVHDADDTAHLVEVGTTRRGHRVRVARAAVEADRLIPIGGVTYHYHAGFGGGRKSLVPGIAARDTIAHNHSLTLDPHADRVRPGVEVGVLDGNPVSEEMFESAAMCKPDCIINTVLGPDGSLVGVFSGHLDAAHRAACRLVETIYRATITERADIVVASAEGATDWVQSHKALFNAARAVKPGGRIVLLAPCPEGLGNESFRRWIREPSLTEMFIALRSSPEIYGQTAVSTRLRGAQTCLVTDLPASDVRDLAIETAPDLDTAAARALERVRKKGADAPTAYLMPNARHTVPFADVSGPA